MMGLTRDEIFLRAWRASFSRGKSFRWEYWLMRASSSAILTQVILDEADCGGFGRDIRNEFCQQRV